MPAVPVDALNALTARWCAVLPDAGTVLSGAGVWPLLAILAEAAAGPARADLATAIQTDPSTGTSDARALVGLLESSDALSTAFGLWTRETLPLRPAWPASLPPGAHATFTGESAVDQAAADAWVRDRTGGVLDHMPLTVDEATMLLLASTLTIETKWRVPFLQPWRDETGSGAWAGRAYAPMHRMTDDPSIVRATADLTLVRVEGHDGIDVELVLGAPDAPAATVLAAAVAALPTAAPLPDRGVAAGVSFEVEFTYDGRPSCRLTVPPFTVRTSHNLLDYPDVLGLRTITDRGQGHLPGISATPLALGRARQDMTATFDQWGFSAAAVTAFEFLIGSVAPTVETRSVCVTFDRPFGFLTVHRDTGLVLAAGWVAEPTTMADCEVESLDSP